MYTPGSTGCQSHRSRNGTVGTRLAMQPLVSMAAKSPSDRTMERGRVGTTE